MEAEGCSICAIRFQHGFCHAAVGAASHLRAMPVLKAFPFDARACEARGIAPRNFH
jgi:hypothetical protein